MGSQNAKIGTRATRNNTVLVSIDSNNLSFPDNDEACTNTANCEYYCLMADLIKHSTNLALSITLICMLGCAGPDYNIKAKANDAVTTILFDLGVDYVSYVVQDNGYVNLTFPRNTPDAIYSKILNKMQQNPDIKGVLAGKGGPVCRAF